MANIISPRTETCFNNDWQFQLTQQNSTTPEPYRTINLPHDWSIELPFEEQWNGATGYLPGGHGRYRKTFENPINKEQKAYLVFDGIYNHATIHLNQEKLAYQANGYAPFYLDITPHLQENNELVIDIDRSRYIDSRWYSGSGIYRNVQLIITNKTHIGLWDNFISTPQITNDAAQLKHQIVVESAFQNYPQTVQVEIIYQTKDQQIETHRLNKTFILSGKKHEELITSELTRPHLWSVSTPHLYTATTKISQNSHLLDMCQINFGIRSCHFDVEQGFFLNNTPMKIKGVCLHHDGGLVGAAVPKQVWLRRLLKLKECGVNAIRIAHNPASNELLDLCDELGFLVQDELFDEWDYGKDKRLNMGDTHHDYVSQGYSNQFQTDAQKDLTTTIKSHRHHPCIFMWSIGNEIEWTYPRNAEATGFFDAKWDGNYFWSLPPNTPEEIAHNLATLPKPEYDIGETAQKLSHWVKQLDSSRPITANCILPSASYLSGYADALDVIGFSYRRVVYDYGHQHYPTLPIIGNENLPQWHEWKAVIEKPHVAGLFLWTGINYMGESHNKWPVRTTDSGLLDCAGFTNQSFYMFQSLWQEEPVLHLVTQTAKLTDLVIDKTNMTAKEQDPDAWQTKLWQWPERNEHWNYEEDEWIVIEAFSNCEEVLLHINDKPIAARKLAEQADHILRWAIPFQAGQLTAIGKNLGKVVCKSELQTATNATKIHLTLEGDAEAGPIRHATIQITDQNNTPIKHQEFTLEIHVNNALLLGVDNGSITNIQSHKSNTVTTHQGRALALIELNDHKTAAGELVVQLTQSEAIKAKICIT